MADFPGGLVAPNHINTYSQYSGASIAAINSMLAGVGAGATASWPSANRAIFVPIVVPAQFKLASFYSANGSAVSGNIDIGLYGPDGSLIASKGSTAASGTTTVQILTVTAQIIQPGRYYLAMSASATGYAILSRSPSVLGLQRLGVLQAASQVPLATLPTFATAASTFMPLFGMSQLTTY